MQILQRSPRRFNAKKPFELFSSPERLRFHFKSGATVKLLTLIFLFPRKELFSLILFLSLPLSLSLSLSQRIFSANIKIHFSPIFCRRRCRLYPQMGRKRRSDIRPISRPDRRLRVVDWKMISSLDCPRRQETADVTSPTAFRRGKTWSPAMCKLCGVFRSMRGCLPSLMTAQLPLTHRTMLPPVSPPFPGICGRNSHRPLSSLFVVVEPSSDIGNGR